MTKVRVFTDGGCKPNPGPGGWAAILKCPEKNMSKELSGYDPKTTNNQMELTAVIRALEALKSSCEVSIMTDSKYIADAFRKKWLQNWKRNGWKTASKSPVKNKELWIALDELTSKHQVEWLWIKGHTGHPENERCDELATDAREFKGQAL